jgi:serine/threonine protein kinase
MQAVKPMIGKTIQQYKILEKLGEGGMGVVYLAVDSKLERRVAIKFLPRHIAGDSDERRRFEIEAKAAASLNHPNITTIYDIEESENGPFIVMEYIEGQELKELIQSGPLSSEEVIKFATQIAEGLQAAHKKGIVHRDIKSANIMITSEGKVKIMDFGLAKMHGGVQVTKVGTTIGTAAYMSPEQARGDEVGYGSDIWSFGVVLYEMLGSKLPFAGNYEQAVIYAILNESFTEVTELNPNVPQNLSRIIEKSLKKNINERYNEFSEILVDLKTSQSALLETTLSSMTTEKSIVVLPFKNISPDPENEYFSDGLTEEIISDLSNVEAIRVISRTSAMRLKGTAKDIKSIGRDLNVQFVLEGSVRKAGNNIRISAQLIEVTKETHLWSEKYNGTLDDIFDIQEKVSRSIVDALRIKLSIEEKNKIESHPIGDPRAYDFYFQARQEILKMTNAGLEKALKLIDHSTKIVGENVPLISARGYIHWMYFNSGIDSDEIHLDETERCAKRIFQIEPHSIHGYRLVGLSQVHRKNVREGIRNFEKVLQIEKNDPDSLIYASMLLAITGKTSEARIYGEKILKIDPLTAYSYVTKAQAPYYEGKFDEAEHISRKALELDPANSVFKAWYFLVIAAFWEKSKVLQYYEESIKNLESSFFTNLAFFLACALKGDKESAKKALREEFITAARNDMQYSVFVADIFALLDQKEEAIGWLENAVERGFINYPFLTKIDPFLLNLHNEGRFQQLMIRVEKDWLEYTDDV